MSWAWTCVRSFIPFPKNASDNLCEALVFERTLQMEFWILYWQESVLFGRFVAFIYNPADFQLKANLREGRALCAAGIDRRRRAAARSPGPKGMCESSACTAKPVWLTALAVMHTLEPVSLFRRS